MPLRSPAPQAARRWPAVPVLFAASFLALACARAAKPQEPVKSNPAQPNILWLTCEDMSPTIGPYGDKYAGTPNLDRFAQGSLRYTAAWSNAPVCAPARTTLISGMYPPSTGSEHMRSMSRLPAGFRMGPNYLRAAGYYCTNNVKEDYNLEKTGKVWDESSARAHWRNRTPGQPFFAVFNFTVTHESQIRSRPHTPVHDPAGVTLPPYHPDTPEVRRDWAQHYDKITAMDAEFGRRLEELEQAGLAEDTIVFFYSDHGSGMPRGKRWAFNSGLQVPLLVRIPEKYRALAPKDYRAGGTTSRLVSFVDFTPTLLSLAGLKPPGHFQGHAFMGKHEGPAQRYLHGFRARMDERLDLVRSVRDERYVYVRNYMPQKTQGQYVSYMFETPTTAVWKRLYDEGKLKAPQTSIFEPKAPEELFDLQKDPFEIHNLAGSAEHRGTLERLRKVQQTHALQIRDTSFLPENELHARSAGSTPYEMARDATKYPLDRIHAAAENAASRDTAGLPRLQRDLQDRDSVVRYWAAMGYLIRGEKAVQAGRVGLQKALSDPAPAVQIVAAEALGRYGSPEDLTGALTVFQKLLSPEQTDYWVTVQALNALDELDRKAEPLLPLIRGLQAPTNSPARSDNYVPRLRDKMLADFN